MTDDLYYRKLESTSTTELVDMIREKDKSIATLEAENERLTVSYETLKLHDEEEIGMLKSENAELKQAKEGKVVEHFEAYGQCRDSRRIAELEAQIEQMKCCPNCDFVFRDGNCYYDKECKNKDHWKLRR